MIDPNEIQAGDLVIIQDARGNVISGPVVETKAPWGLTVEAFGFKIPFAKSDGPAPRWITVPGIKLIDHQGGMVPNADIYIRSKAQLQRNKHLRTNPT
jgi:hypothetical protein